MAEAEEIAEKFGAGEVLPRDVAIAAVGEVRGIAWWDMFAVPVVLTLDAGVMVKCEVDAIPAAQWERHRADYRAPGGHGLKLESAPAAVGLFRYPEGGYGAAIGYRAA